MVARPGDPDRAGRDDHPRRGGGARHGQALRRRRPGASTWTRSGPCSPSTAGRCSEGDWITLDGGTGRVFAGQAALVPPELDQYVRPADGVGRQAAPSPGPGQRRHAGRRAPRPRLRRRGHRALPHRAHVLRGRPADRHAGDDPGRGHRGPEAGAGQAAADAAGRLRGDLPRDGGLPGHASGCSTRRSTSSCPRSEAEIAGAGQGAGQRSVEDVQRIIDEPAGGQPDARPPRLPAGHHLPRDHRDAGPGHLRGRLHRGGAEGPGACPR